MWAFQSIQTKFVSPTNHRGARIKATTSGGLSVTVSFDYELSDVERHFSAVRALLVKHELSWGVKYAIGSSVDGKGYVFTPVSCGDNFATLEG